MLAAPGHTLALYAAVTRVCPTVCVSVVGLDSKSSYLGLEVVKFNNGRDLLLLLLLDFVFLTSIPSRRAFCLCT